MNYPMVQTQVVQMVQQPVYQQQVYTPVQANSNAQYVIAQPQNVQAQIMTPTSAVPVEQINTPTMNNAQVVQVVSNNQQIIYQQQQPTQIITTTVAPITTYAQEGLGQSEIKNGDMVNVATPTMVSTPIVYTTVSSTTQASPVSLDNEEIVFGEQDNKEDYVYACDVKGCGRRFKRAEQLRRHQRCHKSDSGYGKEMLQRQASVSKLKIQAPYVIKTQGPYTPVSYIPSTGISTPISSHPITQMPSPPTNDVSYSNVVVKQDVNNVCKPISPNESTGTYYQGEVSPIAQHQASPIIVTTAGAMYTSDVNLATSNQTVNGSTLFPSIGEAQTAYVQTPTIVQNETTTSVCQMPSPPLQYQPNYTQVTYTQTQPVYTTTTPIY